MRRPASGPRPCRLGLRDHLEALRPPEQAPRIPSASTSRTGTHHTVCPPGPDRQRELDERHDGEQQEQIEEHRTEW